MRTCMSWLLAGRFAGTLSAQVGKPMPALHMDRVYNFDAMKLKVRLFDLPVHAAFLITAFARSPLVLAAYGMPGCTGYPALEAVQFVGGANHQAVAMLPIPNLAVLVGATFHQQALVLDPGAGNALGAVMSEAATAVIGR